MKKLNAVIPYSSRAFFLFLMFPRSYCVIITGHKYPRGCTVVGRSRERTSAPRKDEFFITLKDLLLGNGITYWDEIFH